ncbi:hypothetical protein NVV94_26270 [Pseudomonas sp. LS1212]|uniref:hypothetical protein n=1 Tax=Pseudomonas sp. LS1212 TaxID=2972478 RepID=UPI00215C1D8A|nr:hypothetical protein [Pseudomonas sp. LS1212]UVJ43978.1 hypothetical protein NVV94_26270 [Pseudomonas sp. LS1212]
MMFNNYRLPLLALLLSFPPLSNAEVFPAHMDPVLAMPINNPGPAVRASRLEPIKVTVFLHDDIPANTRASINDSYFSAWRTEMESITGRKVEIKYIANQAPFNNLKYQNVALDPLLQQLGSDVYEYIRRNNIEISSYRTNKFLLLTKNSLNASNAGVAYLGGTTAIASMATYTSPAHELGHLLNGTHERSAVLYNGWWCESYIFPTRIAFRSNCYRYSDGNREAIAAYISDAP